MQEWFLHKMRPEREMLPKEISLKEENFSLVWKLSVEFPREYLCPEKDNLVLSFGWEEDRFVVYYELLDYEGQPFSLREDDLRDILDLRCSHLSTLIRWNGWSKHSHASYFEEALKCWKYSLDYPEQNFPSTRRVFEVFSSDSRGVFEVFSEITNFGTSPSNDTPENRRIIFSLPREGEKEFRKFLEDRLPEVLETFRNDLSTIPV